MLAEQSVASPPGPIHMVDLFAGPGGLDVAAHWLGLVVDGIEWDDNACATRARAGLRTHHADVRAHKPADFEKATVLAGGPPCQTYTVAGSGAGRRALEQVLGFVKRMAAGEDVKKSLDGLDDERTGLVLEPLRWALEAVKDGRPYDAIVLEQVPAVLPVWHAVGEALASVGYKSACGILHTEMFGVPQTRRRAILIARRDRKPSLPTPTHQLYRKGRPADAGDLALLPWETMGKAVSRGVPYVVISNYGTGGDPKARGRRTSDEPAATVTGKVSRNRLVTHDERELPRFSLPEAGRLQTFPIDYPWAGGDISQQIGNAIPPRLAAHVLAAALGMKLDRQALDKAVNDKWEVTKSSKPLAVKQETTQSADALPQHLASNS
ncbi:DNA cytosine methyltransferase [Amycolatopsis australiensis]|uniref:DNA (cytosine-5-)-methyltransferase n=1 Tax=Amycolatopsis australiensis TaxID=546364 RepID=A0A1K1Q591_9PSEU|nr:DNA cytosine methyltransferase [Amycolatopsis australiensis]SFW54851.1 DNA (cytosine-5)-methyltransferase 1 [Amycolatopsis australiensis]